ncbi:MAG: hypothetical protein IJ099_06385 [Alphaproteobacteria bacterium]|nr:hypothetical protein [Alphaproteobacteria bacterium]
MPVLGQYVALFLQIVSNVRSLFSSDFFVCVTLGDDEMKKILILFMLMNLCTGCISYRYDTSKSTIENDKYKVNISLQETPLVNNSWTTALNAYQLNITNYTDDDIEIDWTRTSFITNGQTDGGFMKANELYLNRDLPKNPTIVMPRATQKMNIYPSTLISAVNQHFAIPEGKNGVYLILRIGDTEYKEQLYITKIRE